MNTTGGFCDKRWPFQGLLEDNWQLIRAEYERLSADMFRSVPGLSAAEGWGAMSLFLLGRQHRENCARAPLTTTLVSQIPYMTSAGFAVLQPGKLYKEHVDTYPSGFHDYIRRRWNASIDQNRRLHLPLVADHAYLIAEGERRRLKEGKTLVFLNTRMHAAVNEGATLRAILLLDFLDLDPAA